LPLWIGTEGNIALRGGSKTSAFGTTPFEGKEGEEDLPPVPSLPDLPVEEAPPADDDQAPLQTSAPSVAPAPVPTPTPAAVPTPAPTPSQSTAGAANSSPKSGDTGGSAMVSIRPAFLNVPQGQYFTVSVSIGGAT